MVMLYPSVDTSIASVFTKVYLLNNFETSVSVEVPSILVITRNGLILPSTFLSSRCIVAGTFSSAVSITTSEAL